MRIIAGKYKGRKLNFPKNIKTLRPTSDKVKEAIFSILYDRIDDTRFLDLYAGVGSIGFEALSRGAREAVLIDRDPKYIYKNLGVLDNPDNARVYKNDISRAIEILHKKNEKFDLIFVDPPYAGEQLELALNKLYRFDILDSQGLIIAETTKERTNSSSFHLTAEKIYSETKIMILEHK